MYNTYLNETFYVQDRKTGRTTTLYSRKEFVTHLAEKCIKYWRSDGTTFSQLTEEQNMTSNDLKDCTTFINEPKVYRLRRFTFYRQYNHDDICVIDISPYLSDISDEMDTFYSKHRHKNWCREKKCRPYQIKHHRGKNGRFAIDPELLEEMFLFSGYQPKKEYYDRYSHYMSRSERSWKKQTKNKHQYGNDRRDKFLESCYGFYGFEEEKADDCA